MKNKLEFLFSCFALSVLILLCVHCNISKSKTDDIQQIYIIDYNVNLYAEKESSKVKEKMTFFDPVVVLSDEISSKGKIRVRLQNNTEGWVEEKYTSYIPKNWKKLELAEDYFCYALTKKKISFEKKEDEYSRNLYYMNNDFGIAMGVVSIKNYMQDYGSKMRIIAREIKIGRDKNLNWNKEFIVGNHKVNYIITTDHPDGGVSEMFDFAKLNEMNQQKYYYITFDYQPYESAEKILFQRKILFSILQSLK